jgi:hypothetical protein
MGKNNSYGGKGNVWEYIDSTGCRHRLRNNGYYNGHGWKCDMWASDWWYTDQEGRHSGWAVGTIGTSRANLILAIEAEVVR